MTESPISSYLAAWDALRHRLARLAGDEAALGDDMASDSSNVSPKVQRWATEAHRIAMELSGALEVIDRLADDAADTAVVSIADLAEDDSRETGDVE